MGLGRVGRAGRGRVGQGGVCAEGSAVYLDILLEDTRILLLEIRQVVCTFLDLHFPYL